VKRGPKATEPVKSLSKGGGKRASLVPCPLARGEEGTTAERKKGNLTTRFQAVGIQGFRCSLGGDEKKKGTPRVGFRKTRQDKSSTKTPLGQESGRVATHIRGGQRGGLSERGKP